MLTVSISIEGSVEQPQGRRDEVVRWSTQRKYQASIEMVAERPEQLSLAAVAGNEAGAVPEAYTNLAAQLEACGEDQACMMRLAMVMASSEEFQATSAAAPRYQLWNGADGAVPTQASASYEDNWYTLFYVSGPEITECTLVAPKISPEVSKLGAETVAMLEKSDLETRNDLARAFTIETDAETGTSKLHIPGISAGFGDEKCTLTIGGNAETQHRSTNGTLLPAGELKVPLAVQGSAPGTAVISSGSQVITGNMPLENLNAGFEVDVTVPLKLKVEWTLKALP